MDDKYVNFENKIDKKKLELNDYSDEECNAIKNLITDILDIYKVNKITDEDEINQIESCLENKKISPLLVFSIYLLFDGEIIEEVEFIELFQKFVENKAENKDIIQIIKYYLDFLKGGLKKLIDKVDYLQSISFPQ